MSRSIPACLHTWLCLSEGQRLCSRLPCACPAPPGMGGGGPPVSARVGAPSDTRRLPESGSWGGAWSWGRGLEPHLEAHSAEGQAEAREGGGRVCVTTSGSLFLWGGGHANEGWACHVGLTAGEGVAGDNVDRRPPALSAALLRPPDCRPRAAPRGLLAWPHHVLQEEKGAHENPFYLKKEPGGKPQPTALGGESASQGQGAAGDLRATLGRQGR